ncbi:MAG TPA: exostosin family protein [Solirubrobacteraceae bacterium]|nr:exostosin family protein [Solirubrobacteraceae bacterium]
MLIHLPRLNDEWLDLPVGQFTMHAATDRVGVHQLTDSPDDADVILFTQCHMLEDWRLRRIRDHPLRRAFGDKVLVYNEFDRPWCALPGVYVSMPQPDFVDRYQRPWGYFVPPPGAVNEAPDLLFSFVASNTTRCRRQLFTLQHPEAIVEEVHGFRVWDSTSENFQERRARFQAVLGRSRFVLCPRGNATSSLRLYESLAAGAVPVIIADDWIAPSGPEWERFSIRWPEGRVDGLPEMLEARAADWPVMSREARRAYDAYFSPDVYFHHVAALCGELLEDSATTGFPAGGVRGRRYAALTSENALARARYVRAAVNARTRRLLARR